MTKFDEGKFEAPKVVEVTPQQAEALLTIPPSYANKFFTFVNDNTVRIVFAEESYDKKYTAMRSSVAMSIPSFLTMMNMLMPQAQQIQLAMQNHAKAAQINSAAAPDKEKLQ